MFVCGQPTADLAARSGSAMLDYVTDQIGGRVLQRKTVSLSTAALTYIGIDPDRYRVDQVIPPPYMEDRPDPEQWKVRTTNRAGASVELDLTDLDLQFDVGRAFDRQFNHVHLLLRPCAVLLAAEVGTHPPIPKAREEIRLLVQRPRNLVASLKPSFGRPSFLEGERQGADQWFSVRASLYYQLAQQLVGSVAKAHADFPKAMDATYRATAFALASYGCAQASRLVRGPKSSDLIQIIRERAEFCHMAYENHPRFSGTLAASWAMLAAGSLVQRLSYAISRLFGEVPPSSKQSLPKAAARRWRQCTGERLQALPATTTDDTRLRPLAGRAKNLMDRTDLEGQRLASLAVEALEFFRQDELAEAAVPPAKA